MARITLTSFVVTSLVTVSLVTSAVEGQLNSPCIFDSNCTAVTHSFCDRGTCQCLPGYMERRRGQCGQRRVGDPCTSQIDCTKIPYGQCSKNAVCECKSGYKIKNRLRDECVGRTLSDPCETDTDCSDSVPHSKCQTNGVQKRCACELGYIRRGTYCQSRIIGDSCQVEKDCSTAINNTDCLKGYCKCAAGYTEAGLFSCDIQRIGSDCNKSAECDRAVAHSACRKGKCACGVGYRSPANTGGALCVKMKLKDPCDNHRDCKAAIPGSRCIRANCDCGRGSTPSADQTRCESIQLHDSCRHDYDCVKTPNSACIGNTCQCALAYKEIQTGASSDPVCELLRIGDSCVSNATCTINDSVCVGGKCTCDRGFVADDNLTQCRKAQITDMTCQRSEDCLKIFNNSRCSRTDGKCTCQDRYFEDQDGLSCQFKYLGHACDADADCLYSVDNSECVNNICQCKDTYLPADDKNYCRVQILGGMPCSRDGDCLAFAANSFCDTDNSATCQCRVGYYSNDDFDACLEKQLQDPCSSDEECSVTNANAICSPTSQKCECSLGYASQFSTPVNALRTSSAQSGPLTPKPFCSKRRIGQHECQSDGDCLSVIANSNCGLCSDSSPGSACRQRCQKTVGLSANGITTPNSVSNGKGSSICSTRTCLCNKGFYSTGGGSNCRGRELLDKCQDDLDCSGHVADAVCLEGRNVCTCRPGFKAFGRDVCKQRIIGDVCYKDQDCSAVIEDSFCEMSSSTPNQGLCKCDSGYRSHDQGTACRKRQIGDKTCAVDTDCSDAINGSYCFQNMCVCLQGYIASVDLYTCYRRRLNSHVCGVDFDCSAAVNNSKCENFKCVCVSGFYSIGDEKCAQRKIGDNCKIGSDCNEAMNNSECVSGTCVCKSGFQAMADNSSCVRRRIFDKNCKSYRDCADAVNNSNCRAGRCVCDQGYYPSAERDSCLSKQIGDVCNVNADCSNVINNSQCLDGICTCLNGFDAHGNNSKCVVRPTYIGSECHYTEQCRQIDPPSTCNATHGTISTCVCPADKFVARNRISCVPLPQKLSETCALSSHCTQHVKNSYCNNLIDTCVCAEGYTASKNNSMCHEDPKFLGDFCLTNKHCEKQILKSSCDPKNNTCVCQYGYRQETADVCVERPIIPPYVPFTPPVHVDCENKCSNWTNSLCEKEAGQVYAQCRCDYRHARRYNTSECIAIQTYEITLDLVKEAGRYDDVPLEFRNQYKSSKLPAFQRFAERITLNGLMKVFETSSMRDRYVSADVTSIQNLDPTKKTTDKGVKASVLIHLTADYMNATPLSVIQNVIEEHLTRNDGNLGDSQLKVAQPHSTAVTLTDYDECELDEINDCDPYATCINTLGSFMCVCKSRYEDESKKHNLRPGRRCIIPSTTDDNSDLCSSDDCETRWEFVALALTLFLLIILAFITYEIIQRKQTFNARKLYEKFGTTKIRKLRRASIRRIQQSKKRRKEEGKRKKEENKLKKEEKKREKDEKKKQKQEEKKERDMEKKEAKGAKKGKLEEEMDSDDDDDSVVDTPGFEEAIPPASVEIMHPPSLPFSVTTGGENIFFDDSNLPGSVSTCEGAARGVASPLEESPV